MSNDKERARREFAKRLNEAMDNNAYPPLNQGRQVVAAQVFGVSQAAARKWLIGESMPALTRVEEIARRLGVSINWLLGRDSAVSEVREEQQPYGGGVADILRRVPESGRAHLIAILQKAAAGKLSAEDLALLASVADHLAKR